MPIQLTSEQEKRIQAVVDVGAYTSPEEVLDAALTFIESAYEPGFEGTQQELEALLLEGLTSGEPVEVNEAFWMRLTKETDQMIIEHENPKQPREG